MFCYCTSLRRRPDVIASYHVLGNFLESRSPQVCLPQSPAVKKGPAAALLSGRYVRPPAASCSVFSILGRGCLK
jgi:hypothetical protein